MSAQLYDSAEAFYEDADWPTYAIRDSDHRWWLVWCSEDGDWYASSPPCEDDPSPEGDPYRPVGPVDLDILGLPWLAVALDDLQPADPEVE